MGLEGLASHVPEWQQRPDSLAEVQHTNPYPLNGVLLAVPTGNPLIPASGLPKHPL